MAAGAKLGRYEIVEPVRAAGVGSSYRAVDSQTSRPVMLRALPAPEGRDRETFELEAARLAKLRHPGIVSLIDYGVDNTVGFLVTEFVEGESLATVLWRGDLEPAESLSILRQVAAAVDYAHAAGVVHGDLQLHAVLIDRARHPHVLDFGLGPLTGTAGGPPSNGTVYRAPEQIRSGHAGAAADRYSFAAMASVLVEHAAEPDSPAGKAIDAVIAKGLDDDPTRRWPSCTALVDALGRALVPPAVPAAKENRTGIWIALAAALGIAVLAVLLLVNKPASAPPAPPNAALSISRSAVTQGATLVVSGTHLPANQAGTIELQSRPQEIGTFTADPSGSFSVSVTVPGSTSQGDHVISACWDNACPLHSTLTILAMAPSPSPSQSPSPTPTPSPSATVRASPSTSASP
jgi:serine/threonine protein kinase